METRRNCPSDRKKTQIKQQINKLCVVRHRCCIPKAVISYEVYQRGWNTYTGVLAKFLLGKLLSIFLNPFGSFYRRKKKVCHVLRPWTALRLGFMPCPCAWSLPEKGNTDMCCRSVIHRDDNLGWEIREGITERLRASLVRWALADECDPHPLLQTPVCCSCNSSKPRSLWSVETIAFPWHCGWVKWLLQARSTNELYECHSTWKKCES